MRVLLDTHAIIWFIEGEKKLLQKSIEIIRNYKNGIYVSVASIWEMTIKLSIGKLPMNITIDEVYQFLNINEIKLLNIDLNHLISYLPYPTTTAIHSTA